MDQHETGKPFGKLALSVIEGGMGSSTPAGKPLVAKPPIRFPDTIDEAKALRAWAMAQDDRPEPAAPLQITKHLTFIGATLPSRAQDDESGKARFAVYSSILRDFSNDALAYMARRACMELDWFPTPRQCLEILRDYSPPTTDAQRALQYCHNFWQGRFEDFILALKTDTAEQETVDTVPGQWKRIAVEQGYLIYSPTDERYLIRTRVASTQGMSAGTVKTPEAAEGEARQPGPQSGCAHNNLGISAS